MPLSAASPSDPVEEIPFLASLALLRKRLPAAEPGGAATENSAEQEVPSEFRPDRRR